ncbi:MAG: Fe-S-containing hydro-lyase [Treponema sp.]|jgi:fumarate hydratase subunit beta|nr:Fe-S-containing hydro-lyase [Treponema sp.]
MERRVILPLTREKAASLKTGEEILLSGFVYTARDAAHRRFMELLDRGEKLPFPPEDAVIYYAGPTPAPPGFVTGSAGPTTSGRMDPYTPRLLSLGLRGMIGKGKRSKEVARAMLETGAVYFGAAGGTGALLSAHITSSEIIAFGDLGPEAVRRLALEDFPVTVIMDSLGNDLYETGRRAYLESARIIEMVPKS